MNRIISLWGILVVMAVSCVEEQHIDVQVLTDDPVFYATMEDSDVAATRAYVNDQLRIRWDEGDHISIFNKNTSNREYAFQGQTGDNSGEFRKVPSESFFAGNPLDYVYAVYPFSESTNISDDGEIMFTLPVEQSYRENSFGPETNTMIAVADDNDLMFKNLCGYLMLKLYGDDIAVTSISLKGNNNEPLAGKAIVSASVDGAPSLSFDPSATNEITLTFNTPVTLGTTAETTTTFWLVIPPTVFEAGITLTVETSDGGVFEKRTTSSLAIYRNTRATMAALEVVPGPQIHHYLTFTSDGTTTLSLANYNDNAPVLYYSFDETNWTQWDYSGLSFTSDQPLYICGDNPEGFSTKLNDTICYSTFTARGRPYRVSGDIMSLIDNNKEVRVIPTAYCFYRLFYGLDSPAGIRTAPELPATTLTEYCYSQMFRSCSDLIAAPELPAMTLAERCYDTMFYGCTSLTTAPELHAATLAERCYSYMFYGCTGLRTAPELNATSLADNCYSSMFRGCNSLLTAPELPATTLADNCYSYMFYGCTNLTAAPELPAKVLANKCYSHMFQDCRSLIILPELSATTLADNCYAYMFKGCIRLNYVKCLATDINAEGCVTDWLYDVASTGTFVKAPGMNDWPMGTSGIPEGWTVLSCPEAVDLGLPSGIKWASFNLGASKPEKYGDYYAWGEIEPYYAEGYSQESPCTHWRSRTDLEDPVITGYNWTSYKWCNGSNTSLTKYNTDASYGFVDNKTVLDPEDDAAHVVLGGNWRMPTDAEWTELLNNCTWEWTTLNGVNGQKVTSNIVGYTDKWIFLPAAGYRREANLSDAGSDGNYWSSSLDAGYRSSSWGVWFNSDFVSRDGCGRCYGQSIRPVYCEDPAATGGDTPAGDFASNVTFTAGASAQLGKVKVNGGSTEYDCLKMGTGSKTGAGTVTLPAGTSKVSFYAIGWTSTGTTLVAEIGGNSQEVAVAANSSVSGNSPWNVTVTASDYHTISLGAPLAAETVANVSTVNNSGTRCIVFGIKAE